ncbi:hypothetical protein WJX74_009315 [Apatococcus lobatus]|uniref:UFSP1/2/DUB catalytic domain-containing protein n=1 Tax=Apatococcus lobatus TaxID=904363 RepID=A0AAW1R329_9CHLO
MGVEVVPGLEACLRRLATDKSSSHQQQRGSLLCARNADTYQLLHAFSTAASQRQRESGAFPLHAAGASVLLPAGVTASGIWACTEERTEATAVALADKSRQDVLVALVPPAAEGEDISYWVVSPLGQTAFLQQVPGMATGAAAEDAAAWIAQRFVAARCSLPLSLHLLRPPASGSQAKSFSRPQVEAAFEQLEQQLRLEEACWVACPHDSSPHLLSAEPSTQDSAAEHDCGALLGPPSDPTAVQLMQESVQHVPPGAQPPPAPSLHYEPWPGGRQEVMTIPLSLDILALTPRSMPASQLGPGMLQTALLAQLSSMKTLLMASPARPHSAFHFQPPGWAVPITVIYPLPHTGTGSDKQPVKGSATQQSRSSSSNETHPEAQLAMTRTQLHSCLGLPGERPLLRTCNAAFTLGQKELDARLEAGGVGGPRLRDVHQGIKPSGIAGGSVHLVQGSYDYHHYMQDKFDDSSWGCAYRSLQTLWSWYIRQGYTSDPVPSHRDVQQTLVDLDDKPHSFVGSKQWVGAIELGYILDELLGVTAKVINVSSGLDLPGKARELALHFDSVGSPIMIGGGVLAYTLMGIDWSSTVTATQYTHAMALVSKTNAGGRS